MEWLYMLGTAPPEVVWGLLSRGIGLVLLISFASLAPQIGALAGEHGITPVRENLAAIRRDFPAPQRYFYYPTLLWFNSSDGFLRWLPRLGAAFALSILVGGPHVPYAFVACYLLYLSIDRAVPLIYPWDCLLFEACIWAACLPTTHLLPSVESTSAPAPLVAWVFRLMVFRLMLGFGKHKFLGSTSQDSGFLKGFFVNQPLPTAIGLWVHRLPMSFHKAALWLMFIAEIPVPFAVFFPGPISAFAALVTIGLMTGIQLTGNFGFFNIAMVVVTLSWFDGATAQALTSADFVLDSSSTAVQVLALTHTLLALIVFPFNSFCTHSWMMWSPWWRMRHRWLAWPVTLLRHLHPFRLVHAYGVFPPQSPPPVKFSPVTEVSWDGENYAPVRHKYWPTTPDSPTVFCAPHHERVDQAIIYEGSGVNESLPYRNIAGRWDPYGYGGISAPRRMLQKLVEGTLPERFGNLKHLSEQGPPTHARVRLYGMTPAETRAERQAGLTWTQELIGPHLPTTTASAAPARLAVPPPELWHFEDIFWLERSTWGATMSAATRSDASHHALVQRGFDINSEHIDAFWSTFIPSLPDELNVDWTHAKRHADAALQTFGAEQLYIYERIAHRYACLLFARLAPQFRKAGLSPVFGIGAVTIPAPSVYHLRLLCLHITTQGNQAYNDVWTDPRAAATHAHSLTMASGHRLMVLCNYDLTAYQAQKLRLLEQSFKHTGRPEPTAREAMGKAKLQALGVKLWGALEAVDFMKNQLVDDAESWPTYEITVTTEVKRTRSRASRPTPHAIERDRTV